MTFDIDVYLLVSELHQMDLRGAVRELRRLRSSSPEMFDRLIIYSRWHSVLHLPLMAMKLRELLPPQASLDRFGEHRERSRHKGSKVATSRIV